MHPAHRATVPRPSTSDGDKLLVLLDRSLSVAAPCRAGDPILREPNFALHDSGTRIKMPSETRYSCGDALSLLNTPRGSRESPESRASRHRPRSGPPRKWMTRRPPALPHVQGDVPINHLKKLFPDTRSRRPSRAFPLGKLSSHLLDIINASPLACPYQQLLMNSRFDCGSYFISLIHLPFPPRRQGAGARW